MFHEYAMKWLNDAIEGVSKDVKTTVESLKYGTTVTLWETTVSKITETTNFLNYAILPLLVGAGVVSFLTISYYLRRERKHEKQHEAERDDLYDNNKKRFGDLPPELGIRQVYSTTLASRDTEVNRELGKLEAFPIAYDLGEVAGREETLRQVLLMQSLSKEQKEAIEVELKDLKKRKKKNRGSYVS